MSHIRLLGRRDLERAIALVAVVAAPALAEVQALPTPTKDFSADVSMRIDGLPGAEPNMQFQGTVQYDVESGRYRREQTVMGQQNVILQDTKGEKVWILMPAMMSYIEASPKEGSNKTMGVDETSLESLEKVGTETIDGIETTKYAADFEGGSGHIWVTKDQITLKMAGTMTQNGQTLTFSNELSNLKLEDQSPAAFQIPDGYSPLTIPDFSQHGGAAGGGSDSSGSGGGGDVLAEQEFRVDDGFAEGETVRVDLVDDDEAAGR